MQLLAHTETNMAELEAMARSFAQCRHSAAGQTRKYTVEPYINHPAAVVDLVRGVAHTPQMLAAAWLHDVVEDTDTKLDELRQKFGHEVACLVGMLTDVSTPNDGNRAARKAIDRSHTAKASPAAKTIKLADVIDNSHSIIERDPKFAEVFLAEKAALLEVLAEGDPCLYSRAMQIVRSNTRCYTGCSAGRR